MNNRKLRNHFSIIFEKMGALTVFFLIIFLKQGKVLTRYVKDFASGAATKDEVRNVMLLFLLYLVLLIVVVVYNYLTWKKTTIWMEDNAIVVEVNTWNKKVNTYGIDTISSVNMEQNLFERFMGTYKVKIDTNSLSTANATDIMIVFDKETAFAFKKAIVDQMEQKELSETYDQVSISGKQPESDIDENVTAGNTMSKDRDMNVQDNVEVKFSNKDILLHCLYSSSILLSLFFFLFLAIVGVVVYVKVSANLNHVLPDLMKNRLELTLTVGAALGGTLYGAVKKYVKYYGFCLERKNQKLVLSYGLLRKMNYEIPITKINSLQWNQSMLGRIFHRYCVEVVTIGVGDDKEEGSVILLYGKESEMYENLNKLLPEFDATVLQKIKGQSPSCGYHLLGILLGWVIAFSVISFVGIQLVGHMIFWFVGSLVITLWIAILLFLQYKTRGIYMEEKLLVIQKGYFMKKINFIHFEKVQHVKMKKGPISKKTGLVKGELYILATATSQVHPIPYMEEDQFEELMRNLY